MQIRVSFGKTKSLPGFNNIRADAEIIVDINDPNKLDDAYKRAWNKVKNQVDIALGDKQDSAFPAEEIPF